MNLKKMLSESFLKLHPYKAGLTSETLRSLFNLEHIYKFSSNESPFPPSPLAIQAIQTAIQLSNRYPDYQQLLQSIARHCELTTNNVLLGTGSINVLDTIFQTFSWPGANVVFSSCSYFAYPLLAHKSSLTIQLAECGANLDCIVENLAKACNHNTCILVIDNPGNLSGAALSAAEIYQLLQAISPSTIVILDQAYEEFSDAAALSITAQTFQDFPNLIVARTFSKAYGLAALRVGFALAEPAIIDWLQRVQQPFPVSNLGCAAAIAALQDRAYTTEVIRQIKRGRTYIKQALTSLGIPCYNSHANFVLADFGAKANDIYNALLAAGFITRPMHVYNRPELIRISVGTATENELLVIKIANLIK